MDTKGNQEVLKGHLIHDNRMLAERAFYCFYVSTEERVTCKSRRKGVSVYSQIKTVREHSFRIGQSIFSIEHSIDGLCFHQAQVLQISIYGNRRFARRVFLLL